MKRDGQVRQRSESCNCQLFFVLECTFGDELGRRLLLDHACVLFINHRTEHFTLELVDELEIPRLVIRLREWAAVHDGFGSAFVISSNIPL